MRPLMAGLAALLACGCARGPDLRTDACPAGHALDAARSERIVALLARDPEAAPLLRSSAGDVRMCYAPRGAGVIASNVLLLDQLADDRAVAARAAHLLHHHVHGVDEATARSLEARILERKGVLHSQK